MVSKDLVKGLQVFALVGYSICTLVFGILAYKQVSSNADEAIDIFTNWKTGAIQELTVANNRPVGYEELFNYTWPGIDSGCDCRKVSQATKNTFKVKEDLTHSACDQKQIHAGCHTISRTGPANIDSWGRVDNRRVQVYALRSNETWADVALLSGEECKNPNLKKCGSNANNTFCTALNKCPITSVSIEEGFAEECLGQNDCFVLSTDYGKTKLLKASRGEDALPLAEMRINEYGMCHTKWEDNITPGRVDFEWQNNKRSTCTGENKQWTAVDKINERDLFEFNDLTPILNNYIPLGYYPSGRNGNNYEWGLFARRFVPWYTQCRSQMPGLLTKHQEIQNVKNVQLALLVITGIISFVLGIVVSIFICTDQHPGLRKGLNWGGKILLIPFQVVAILTAGGIAKFLSGSALDGCSDDYTVGVFAHMGAGAANAYSNNVRGIITSIAAIVLDIVLWVFTRSQSQQEPYYPQVNVEIQTKNKR